MLTVIKSLALFFQIMFIFIGCIFLYVDKNTPNLDLISESELQQPIRIYSKDGKLIGFFGIERRELISFEQIPENLKNAVLAAEDKDYFNHSGVKISSLVRALLGELTGSPSGGGGTISMQVVRSYLLSTERTYERKLKEIYLAWRLEEFMSKEEILQLYFNKTFLGNRNYGFKAAYDYYFGKNFNEISIADSATLAAILQRPSAINPKKDPAKTKKRRNLILKRMFEEDLISSNQYQQSILENIDSKTYPPILELEAPHFSESIRKKVLQIYGSDAFKLGLNVYTTLDSEMQINAINSVNENLFRYQQNAKENNLNENGTPVEAAFIAMDYTSGEIKAYVGGNNFQDSKFDRVTAKLMPGSTIKPFIYSCAFENGLRPATVVVDGPIIVKDELLEDYWRPKNNSGNFHGPVRLRESLIESLNSVSIKLTDMLGFEKMNSCFDRYGFSSSMDIKDLSGALGNGLISPYELAQTFSIFPNSGTSVDFFMIEKITNRKGEVYFQNTSKGNKERLGKEIAFITREILKEGLDRFLKFRNLNLVIENAGGKTGTTNDARDTWFVGYAENIIASSWVGKDDGSTLGDEQFGSSNALPIWLDFMNNSIDLLDETTFVIPEDITLVRIDKNTGKVTSTFDNAIFEYFLDDDLKDILN
ncbi:transglycosylase domain-containing protein [SAR86 cluster bacterium]|uniref:Transglycosylase domain-containing protein n=1 Tax=SAR86 cluster bacterium TaxID=2030880 RepID=A0A9Q8X293_9GAMM|nr:transglycosylase domain-containing protein [SAR86 cluster bacterium]